MGDGHPPDADRINQTLAMLAAFALIGAGGWADPPGRVAAEGRADDRHRAVTILDVWINTPPRPGR